MTVGRNLAWFFLSLGVAASLPLDLAAQSSRRTNVSGVTRVPSTSTPRPGTVRRTVVRQDEMMPGVEANPLDMPAQPQRGNPPPAVRPETRQFAPNGAAEAPQPLHEEIDTWLDQPHGGGEYYDDGGYGGDCCGPMGCGMGWGCGPFGMWGMGMGGCCPPRFYVRAEYLLWWTDGQTLPALVTTSPPGTARAAAGVLGQPNTTILYGNQVVNDGSRSGGRITGGFWLDECLGIEGDYFRLADATDNFALASNGIGQPTIARPYFNAQTNLNDAELIAFNLNGAPIFTGSVAIQTSSSLEAAGIFLRKVALQESSGCRTFALDFLAGWRYAKLNERIAFQSSRTSLATAGAVPVNTTLALTESFETENRFNGLDLGLAMRSRRGVWTFDVTGRFAFGSMARQTDINGETTVTVPGQAPVITPGGLLAQRTNIGRYRDDEFAFLPEVSAKAGIDITCNLRATVGYNFFAITNVGRAVDQIDTTVNTSQVSNQPLVGPARPIYRLVDSDFWAQGLSVGLEGEF